MNIQVGKSAGIALLMAAALLAALFAMGVFAPAAVDAGVYVEGDKAPTAKLVDENGRVVTTKTDAQDDLKLVIEFEVDDAVDGRRNGVAAEDDITITVPAATNLTVPTLADSNVSVMQGGKSVGTVTYAGTTGITIAPHADNPLAANTRTTVTIMEVEVSAGSIVEETTVAIVQQPSAAMAEAKFSVPNLAEAPTNASAALGTEAGTLEVKFTARNVGPVVVNPAVDYLLTDSNVTTTGGTQDLTTDGQITVTPSALTDGTTAVMVTIDSLFNVAAGDMITLSQAATGYSTTLEVDGDAVSPTTEMDDGETGTFEFSSKNAGAAVKITLTAEAGTDNALAGGDDIVVDLPGFVIPSSIDEDDVLIDGNLADAETDDFRGNPESVAVNDSKITLTLPNRMIDPTDGVGSVAVVVDGMYEITFKQSAGLTNPNSAGLKTITVADEDDDADEFKVLIASVVSIEPKSGFVTRGGDATVTAKGLRDGTTTVYLLEMNDDDEYVRSSTVLGNGRADDGVVMIDLDTSLKALKADAKADGNKDMGVNKLRVIDSNDDMVGMDLDLGIKPTVKLTSETAKRSATLEITVSDWYYGDIEDVTIAGLDAEFVGDDDVIDVGSDNTAKFKVTVPGNVRGGEQEVKVYGDDDDLNTTSATAMVNITALPLDVSPSDVVPGHRVTITGSGFANSQDVDEIMIGGKDIDVPDDADSTSSGRVAVTVTVPLDVGSGAQKVTLTVGTRTGEGSITVPKPSIELDPSESVPGSVISVTGSGFAADGRVEVKFAGDIEEVGRADGSGDVHIRLEIPSDAGVGTTNEVVVAVRDPDDTDDVEVDISAKADHKTPGPAITVPAQAQVGTLATISGTNFEPFTSLTVMIGGKDATPSPAETDKNGAFEVQARVPRLSAGSHTITVEDGSLDENSVTETFTVVLTPVVSTPEEVFGGLGDALVSVWSLNNATKVWSAYFPGAPEGVSDLTGVSRGDIVWINVNADVAFQGGMLTTGWNLISLE